MVQNIIAGIMTAIAIAAGVFGWWMDNINVVEHEINPGIDSQRNSNDGITENSVNMKNDTREEK